jgi:hypothetical protein
MNTRALKFAAVAFTSFAAFALEAMAAPPAGNASGVNAAPAATKPAVNRSTKASLSSAATVASKLALPPVVVHKSATCGCCVLWVEHMRSAGFKVEVRNEDNLDPIKIALGVPVSKRSCHTAEVGGYFIEGHVPANDVKRLLAKKPKAKGLALPGMPLGSPGMETPDGQRQPYAIELVGQDGTTTTFARY